MTAPADGSTAPIPGPVPISGAEPPASPPPPPPTAVPAPAAQPAAVTSSLMSGPSEQCSSCGAMLAADQRYCLECGHRRGDPRLPFMDAVVFMDAVKQPTNPPPPPPPPAERKQGLSANASLVAGIGTLVLAIGVGVLIGRGGEHGSSTAAATPQIIKVGGGSETASTAEPEETTGSKGKSKGKSKKAAKKAQTGSSGATKATESVFKPNPNVKLPPPTVKLGGKCEGGTAGCENGEFNGNFFGE